MTALLSLVHDLDTPGAAILYSPSDILPVVSKQLDPIVAVSKIGVLPRLFRNTVCAFASAAVVHFALISLRHSLKCGEK